MNIKPLEKYTILILLLLNIPLICYYNKKLALMILAVLFILVFIFRFTKFADKAGKALFQRAETAKTLYLIAALFISIQFFEQNIAVFSISIVLIYKLVSTILKSFARIRLRSTTLEGAVIGAIAAYFTGGFLCNLLGLDKNIAVSSAVALPFIELIVSWPDENFSLPFLAAVVAQFVKNSF